MTFCGKKEDFSKLTVQNHLNLEFNKVSTIQIVSKLCLFMKKDQKLLKQFAVCFRNW